VINAFLQEKNAPFKVSSVFSMSEPNLVDAVASWNQGDVVVATTQVSISSLQLTLVTHDCNMKAGLLLVEDFSAQVKIDAHKEHLFLQVEDVPKAGSMVCSTPGRVSEGLDWSEVFKASVKLSWEDLELSHPASNV